MKTENEENAERLKQQPTSMKSNRTLVFRRHYIV